MSQRAFSLSLDFANSLPELLSSPPHSLDSDIQPRINSLLTLSHPSRSNSAFEAQGITLWNLAIRLTRATEDASHESNAESAAARPQTPQSLPSNRVIALVRVFAFLLLDYAAGRQPEWSQRGRPLKVANKAARVCLHEGLVEVGVKVLERMAMRLENREDAEGLTPEDVEFYERMHTAYLVLRLSFVSALLAMTLSTATLTSD